MRRSWDDREKLVLVFWTAARYFIKQHRFCVPKVALGTQVGERRPFRVWHRKAQQIIEGNQACVVVPVLEFKCSRNAVQQFRFGGAVPADQQQCAFIGQRGEDNRIEMIQSEKIERTEQMFPPHMGILFHLISFVPGLSTYSRTLGNRDLLSL